MLICDSQIHIWKEETPDRPWIPGARERMKLNGHRLEPFTYEEALDEMNGAGVDRVCIVPPSWEGDRVDYGIEASEKYPDRFCVMARITQDDEKEGGAMMRDFATIDAIKGLRLTFHRPQDRNWMIDGTCDWIWPLAEKLGLPLMVHAPIWKTELGKIAERHPDLRIIVDHMGILARSVDDAIGYWVEETADLHVHPNISMKVSAVPGYSTHPYPYDNLTKYVKMAVEKMGPARCHWGTDVTRLIEAKGITYTQTVEHFTKHMGFTEAELDQIMGKGLCDILGWAY
ncbi:MAG: amidohydrolase family protein [Qingshengfaniella sp.]